MVDSSGSANWTININFHLYISPFLSHLYRTYVRNQSVRSLPGIQWTMQDLNLQSLPLSVKRLNPPSPMVRMPTSFRGVSSNTLEHLTRPTWVNVPLAGLEPAAYRLLGALPTELQGHMPGLPWHLVGLRLCPRAIMRRKCNMPFAHIQFHNHFIIISLLYQYNKSIFLTFIAVLLKRSSENFNFCPF